MSLKAEFKIPALLSQAQGQEILVLAAVENQLRSQAATVAAAASCSSIWHTGE